MSEILVEQGEQTDALTFPATLPVLPLKETVVFPESMTPLAIGQDRSVKLIEDVVSGERLLALITVRNEEADQPGWDDLYDVGTAAVVHKMIKVPDGTLRILVQGLRRIRLEGRTQTDPYLVGEFSEVPDVLEESREVEALTRNVQGLFARVIGLVPYLPEELQIAAANVEDPSALCNLVASTLRLKPEEKQKLLELADVHARLREISAILNRELEVFELGSKIQSQVQEEMEKGQREFFLRQQLKAIQEELGEGDAEQAEINELRARFAEMDLPEEVQKAADRELARLEKLPAAAAEYGVIRTYLDWLVTLPWDKTTPDHLDLKRAKKVLDEDHFDLEKVKERILEYLAVSKLKNDLSGPILCFVGPPGVGKTSLGQSVARTLGRKFQRLSVGGVRDEAEIRGHRRTYIGAMPGTIIRAIRDAESLNPVVLIDEIDKMGADFRGDPASAMLEVLDPEQNKSFRDHYLDLPFDLSKVLFICTANTLDTIPSPLLDRMDVIHLSGYTEDEKFGIARKYLVPKQLEAHGLGGGRVTISDKALRLIIRAYTREAGVRNLERQIAAVLRKAAREVEGEDAPDRRAAYAQLARTTALLGRGAQADVGAGCRDRAGVHGGRRRRPLHRGDRVSGKGPPDDHRPARRGDAGVRAGRPVLGALARLDARGRAGVVHGARHPHSRARRRRAQGRPVGRSDDGDRDRLARPRGAGLRGRRHDRRDHAHRAGAADRRRAREGARGRARRAQARGRPERERARSRGAAARDEEGARIRPRRLDRRGLRRRVRRSDTLPTEARCRGRARAGR
jgi:ATP-dependent Lon protease